jgi:hypothetical protein
MTNLCSSWAYEDIKKTGYMGEAQAKYLFVFARENMPLTHKQATNLVEKEFHKSMPQRNGRIAELSDMGFIKAIDTVQCEFTGKTVTRWMYTGRKVAKVESFVNGQCPCCKGVGYVRTKVWIEPDTKTLEMFPDLVKPKGGLYVD